MRRLLRPSSFLLASLLLLAGAPAHGAQRQAGAMGPRLGASISGARGKAALGPAPTKSQLQSVKAAAVNHFFNLEYAPAIAGFKRIAAAKPHAAGAWNHLAQAELYQEMYRMGALESTLYGKGDDFLRRKLLAPDPQTVAAINNDLKRAQSCAQAAMASHPDEAQAHYDLAVAWGLEANLAFSVKQSYWDALGDAKNARRQAEIAHRLKPGWVDPLLIIGVQNYVAGSLPWSMKIFTTLIGYRGNKTLGLQQIAAVARSPGPAQSDAQVLLAVADRRDGRNRAAAALFSRLATQYPRNVLFAVETGEAYEAAGEHDAARAALQAIIERQHSGAPGYQKTPLAQVWYDLGSIAAEYSHWRQAGQDYARAAAVPSAPPHTRAAARKAAAQAARKVNAGSSHLY